MQHLPGVWLWRERRGWHSAETGQTGKAVRTWKDYTLLCWFCWNRICPCSCRDHWYGWSCWAPPSLCSPSRHQCTSATCPATSAACVSDYLSKRLYHNVCDQLEEAFLQTHESSNMIWAQYVANELWTNELFIKRRCWFFNSTYSPYRFLRPLYLHGGKTSAPRSSSQYPSITAVMAALRVQGEAPAFRVCGSVLFPDLIL